MKSGRLASVCRYWASVIASIGSLWSTLWVGAWTETERVALWMQRGYPKKVIIDTQEGCESPSETPSFPALQSALTSTEQWHELTIYSFPPENVASQLGIRGTSPMNVLKVLYITAGCLQSPSFTDLLNLVPTEAPLCELRLYSAFASSHFLQPHWFPVLRSLTVLIISGRDMHGPFELLPIFTQLQIFEADRVRIPFYEPNANLPLLCTIHKLRLRACSVQWMAGRHFPCLEECVVLLPRHWEVIQQYGVQLPSCKKLTYHGHPMTTVRYFHAPKTSIMELKSHDCNEQRVHRHLRHLCRADGWITKLTTLHLTIQCSEQVLFKFLKYLVPLQELFFSIAGPSLLWESFLETLAAKPSTKEWPAWNEWEDNHQEWEEWCSAQTWHANILPQLKSLDINCPKGFYRSEWLDHFPLLRLVGWTRTHLTPPLGRLKVWESGGMDDTMVDYISIGYLRQHLGVSNKGLDCTIIRGMVTKHLVINDSTTQLLHLHSAGLFRQLQHLVLFCPRDDDHILILSCLEEVKRLHIRRGIIPVNSLEVDLPLTHTLQFLKLDHSSISWMLGRFFKALREFHIDWAHDEPEDLSRHKGKQVHLPACTTLQLKDCPTNCLRFFSCPNVQILRWSQFSEWTTFDWAALNSFHSFLSNLSCLQQLYIYIYSPRHPGLESLCQFVFCDAREQGVWRNTAIVEVGVLLSGPSWDSEYPFFTQLVGRYENWWTEFTVTRESWQHMVIVRASM